MAEHPSSRATGESLSSSNLAKPDSYLRVGQMNVARIRKDLINLSQLTDVSGNPKFDILLITEPPYTVKRDSIFIPNKECKVFYARKTSSKKWSTHAAIYVLNNSLTWRPIVSSSTSFFAEIEVFSKNMKLRIASVYITAINETALHFETLRDRALNGKTQIIGGDLNGRHDLWERRGTCNRIGRLVHKFARENNWVILNRAGDFTRRPLIKGHDPTTPDITMAQLTSASLVSEWKVDQTSYLSDHLCISFRVQVSIPQHQTVFRAASNSKVAKEAIKALSQLKPSDITYDNLVKTINTVKNTLASKSPNIVRNSNCRENKNIWRTRKLINKISRVLKANSDSNFLSNDPTCLPLKAEIDNLSLELKKRRCHLINKKIREIRNLRSKSLAKKIKRQGQSVIWKEFNITDKNSNNINIIRTGDDALITDQVEILNLIMTNLASKQPAFQTLASPPTNLFRDHALNLHEIDSAIVDLKSRKACGTDGISAKLLKDIHGSNHSILHNFISQIWANKSVPDSIKQSRLTILSKSKEPIGSIDCYRPIGMPNQLLKVLELVISERLRYFVNRNLTDKKQFGAKRTVSTSAALIPITNFVINNTNLKRRVCIWKADVEGAFENLNPASILNILKDNIPNDLWALIQDLLTNRSVHLSAPGIASSAHFMKTTGTTQGSVLSPILFAAVMSILHKKLDSAIAQSKWNNLNKIGPFSYADDFFGAFTGPSNVPLSEQIALMDEFLLFLKTNFNSILESWGLKLAEHKSLCTFVPFPLSQFTLHLSNFLFEKNMAILGVTFGNRKNSIFGAHIDIKYNEIIALIEDYRNNSFNMSPLVRKAIAENVLLPKLLYQAETWASFIGPQQIKKVNSAMRLISAFSIGGTKSTSLLAASALSGIPPGFIWIKELELLSKIRSDGILVDNKVRHLQDRIDITAYYHPANTPMPDTIITEYICEDNLAKEEKGHIHLYTDASWSAAGDGIAVTSILAKKDLMLKTHRFTNCHELELVAIRVALWVAEDLALTKGKALKEITILTDSLSAVKQISNRKSDSETVLLIRNSISHHKKWNRKINLIWIKGHDDYYGNIRADQLARRAVQCGTEFEVNIPISVIKKLLKTQSKSWWTSWCREELANSTHLKKIFSSETFPPSFPSHPNWAITGLLTSHSPMLDDYRARILRVPGVSGRCICDNHTPQDGIHALITCPLLVEIRIKICAEVGLEHNWLNTQNINELTKDPKFYKYITKLVPQLPKHWPRKR